MPEKRIFTQADVEELLDDFLAYHAVSDVVGMLAIALDARTERIASRDEMTIGEQEIAAQQSAAIWRLAQRLSKEHKARHV